MSEHRFEIVGGDPTLDFLNTISDWTAAEPRDYLPRFSEALRFGEAAGLLTPAEARRLAGHRGGGRGGAGVELRRLTELRARLERIFRAVVEGRPPPAEDLEALSRQAAEAARRARLRPSGRRLARVIDVDAAGAAVVRARLADAAVALLTSPRLARVKSCPTCGWFFIDTSKNRSRRWCSMAMCGSRAKSRRYYRRSRRRTAE